MAGKRHLGELSPAPFRDPHRPATKPAPAPVMHKDMRCLIEGGSDHFVAAAADMAVIVNLARTVAPWSYTAVRKNGLLLLRYDSAAGWIVIGSQR